MQRTVGTTVVEGLLIDWAVTHSAPGPQVPVSLLDDRQVAAELDRLQRDRARTTAREAELILRLAELRPDVDDPPPGSPGARARSSSRVTDLEFPGVSEFFVDEVAHSINLGRGTAAFRARRAWTWRENLPATYAALRDGRIDERRAGVLADALQHIAPELARAVESDVLPQALDLAPAALRRRALALLTELDTDAVDTRREEAERAADVRVADAGDGMATLTADLRAEDATACFDVIDQLAHMARSDGDARPIGQLRGDVLSMLVLRPADHGLADVHAQVTVTACLEGLERRTDYPDLEIVVVDNGSVDPRALTLLDEARGRGVRVLRVDEPFNFSRLCNLGAEQGTGEILALVNNDVEPLAEGWLRSMVAQAQRADVGAVGALLLYEDRSVQHAGIALGPGDGAIHPWRGLAEGRIEAEPRVALAGARSAVTAACLAVRRDRYLAVGGMDETAFPVTLNDVDLCLKLNARGWRTLYEPAARLLHLEGRTRPADAVAQERPRRARELRAFRERWAEALKDDPFYSPALDREGRGGPR